MGFWEKTFYVSVASMLLGLTIVSGLRRDSNLKKESSGDERLLEKIVERVYTQASGEDGILSRQELTYLLDYLGIEEENRGDPFRIEGDNLYIKRFDGREYLVDKDLLIDYLGR